MTHVHGYQISDEMITTEIFMEGKASRCQSRILGEPKKDEADSYISKQLSFYTIETQLSCKLLGPM